MKIGKIDYPFIRHFYGIAKKQIPSLKEVHAFAAFSHSNDKEASLNMFLSEKGATFSGKEKWIMIESVKDTMRHFNPNYDQEQIDCISEAYDMSYPNSIKVCGEFHNSCKCQQCLDRKTLFNK
jgi:hypothetical protein